MLYTDTEERRATGHVVLSLFSHCGNPSAHDSEMAHIKDIGSDRGWVLASTMAWAKAVSQVLSFARIHID